jgi:hypothetical protein
MVRVYTLTAQKSTERQWWSRGSMLSTRCRGRGSDGFIGREMSRECSPIRSLASSAGSCTSSRLMETIRAQCSKAPGVCWRRAGGILGPIVEIVAARHKRRAAY